MSPEGEPVSTARDTITGLLAIIERDGRTIGSLERAIATEGDVDADPKGSEIRALFERWQRGTGRTTTKLGKPRVKLVRARLRDGFPLASDKPEPSLELAVDGIAAFPFRQFTTRKRDGKPSELENDFDLALRDERHVEALARYGYKARQAGWTLEDGWPE